MYLYCLICLKGKLREKQINFFAYYVGAPLDKFLRKLYGGPLRSVSNSLSIGAPSICFLRILYEGPPQINFFAYYMGAPSGQFLRLL